MIAAIATAAFVLLLAAFWFVAQQFGVTARLQGHVLSALVSFALILGPYWAFGFGLGDWVRRKLENRGARILGILLLITPYLVFSIPRGDLHAGFCFGFAAVLLCDAALLGFARPEEPGWADAFALAIL